VVSDVKTGKKIEERRMVPSLPGPHGRGVRRNPQQRQFEGYEPATSSRRTAELVLGRRLAGRSG